VTASIAAPGTTGRDVLVRRVKLLSWLSLAWMTAEGVIGVAAGIAANSIALIGYGLDSTIEGIASVVIIWRFTGARALSDTSEAYAQRVVAVTFFLLVPYIGVEAVRALVTGSEPEKSWVGIGLAIVSSALMPVFGHAKKPRHTASVRGDGWRGDAKHPVRVPLAGDPRRARSECAARLVVGRPTRGPRRRLGRASGGRQDLARRRVLRGLLTASS
jgi:hypothetical protein